MKPIAVVLLLVLGAASHGRAEDPDAVLAGGLGVLETTAGRRGSWNIDT